MHKSTKTFLFFLLMLLASLVSVCVYRAYVVFKPCRHDLKKFIDDHQRIRVSNEMLETVQRGLQYSTVSFKQGEEDLDAKVDYVAFIRFKFHDLELLDFVTLNKISNYSLLYKIQGRNADLKPYLITAHYDVVPAEAEQWKYHPFSGEIKDGFINGRGTMDNKASMISQLEAMRLFLREHGQPSRTIYLAYGHDEEITGRNGAAEIAAFLGDIQLEYVMDEGSMVIEDIFPDLQRPQACIGIAEKGYLSVRFSVNVTGGHSSMPDNDQSAIYILSEAITRLKNIRQPAILMQGPAKLMLEKIAVNLDFFKRVLLTNIWLFAPLIERIFAKKTTLDSLQRTSTAVTIFEAGLKDNVLPSYGQFVVNHRIHSTQSCAEVLAFDIATIADSRVYYEVLECIEPSAISPTDSLGFFLLEHITRHIYPKSLVQPSVLPGMTDSRYYGHLTRNIYKYFPIQIKNVDLKRYHGVDERISIQNYENIINFFYLVFKKTDQSHLTKITQTQNLEL